MNRVSHAIEAILFRSRFLLAPLYLGLVGALILLAYRFVIERERIHACLARFVRPDLACKFDFDGDIRGLRKFCFAN